MVELLHSIALDFPPLRRTLGNLSEAPVGVIPSFVVGPENEELLDLLSPSAIVEMGNRSPVFLYGATGVGKTVIGLTIAGRWSMAVDNRQITITTGSDFSRQFAHACEADDMDRFRQRHRSCRLLLLDGVHELVGKGAAQEELINTLDELTERRCPVIATGPKLPGSIRGIRAPLASRLMSGASLQLLTPGREARSEILSELNRTMGTLLSGDELSRLVDQLPTSSTATQLRGVLIQWLHQQRCVQGLRDDSLRTVIENQQKARIPAIQDISKAVSKHLGVKISDLRGATRKSNVVRARGLAMYLTRQWTSMSLQQIGEYFGNRDHTTVLHACRKTEGDLSSDVELLNASEELRQNLC